VARARFRDFDGVTRPVEASGVSGAAAERALLVKLRDRSAPSHGDINPETTIGKLAQVWLAQTVGEQRLAPQTLHGYRRIVANMVVPGLGGLRLREATVGRLDRFLRQLASARPGAARGAKCVLGQMFALAVRYDAVQSNPVRDTGRLPKNRRAVRALTLPEVTRVREAVRAWQDPAVWRPGPRHSSVLADVVDVLLATGGRIGEVLALRWCDLDLDADPPTVTFAGTMVYVHGHGHLRQDRTKTAAGHRTLVLPPFAVTTLATPPRPGRAAAGGRSGVRHP
jgi:hypothetical protein